MFGPNSKNFQVPDIAIVRQQKKRLPYSIIPIGGKAELAQWKKDEQLRAEARDVIMKPIREATRLRAIAMVENQNATLNTTESDKALLDYNRDRDIKVRQYIPEDAAYSQKVPKKGLLDKFKEAALALINSAFPE